MTIERILSHHKTILLDSCVLIYHIEEHRCYVGLTYPILEAVTRGECQAMVSELALMEIKIGPLHYGDAHAAGDYELLLDRFPNLSLVSISRPVLNQATRLRARYRLKTPDAIILATALGNGAILAVTNDQGWKRVEGIEVLCLNDLVGGQ